MLFNCRGFLPLNVKVLYDFLQDLTPTLKILAVSKLYQRLVKYQQSPFLNVNVMNVSSEDAFVKLLHVLVW